MTGFYMMETLVLMIQEKKIKILRNLIEVHNKEKVFWIFFHIEFVFFFQARIYA